MVLRVKLHGKGKDGDPYRAHLPTYSHLHGNVAQGFAVVNMPDEITGLSPEDLATITYEETTEGPQAVNIPQELLDKIHAHWDDFYAGSKIKYRIEEV